MINYTKYTMNLATLSEQIIKIIQNSKINDSVDLKYLHRHAKELTKTEIELSIKDLKQRKLLEEFDGYYELTF
jgi:hypothetical protein